MKANLCRKLMATHNGLSPLILRVPVGIVLIPHGAQKLFGWFGGGGLQGTGRWMASIGLEPGMLMALLAGSMEFFGGIALLIGLLTRLVGLALAFQMLIAILFVHLGKGLFVSEGGWEYALVLLAAGLSLMVSGGGRFSVDGRCSC
ncbi:oxidoreductase [Marinobacterium zhoushanense]|uniref:Oxidoreductase n=1 Tax=Marinobacterium zhoushanense TaxID=1679163 RepID=A0ABQ1KU94_9GAMM|nr:DoxX family protein [Marinobacterium zhoushanense]GGC10296.1 oxidoreductase [Marinobacterium zhoushanense]